MKIIHIPSPAGHSVPMLPFEDVHYTTWATPFARKTLEFTKRYEIEIWHIYDPMIYGHHGISIREKDRITFKQFPAKRILSKYTSPSLLKELQQKIKNNEKILVHLQTIHEIMSYKVAKICKRIPLVAQQRAPTSPPIIKFKRKKKVGYLFMQLFDNLSLKHYDFIFAPSIDECQYLIKKIGKERVMHQKGGGFDFKRYKPRQKEQVRIELGLPLDKKILIYVGRFTKLKGLDVILDVYKKLTKIRSDVELVVIGGNETQPLYNTVMKSKAIVKGYIPKDDVIKYLNASDVYLLPTEDKIWIRFGDIDNTIIESLAMNRPVVSPMLIHFAGSQEERKILGIITKNREDVLKAVEYIFKYPEKFKSSREIMEKYYDWERIIRNNVIVYNKLFNKYYGL